MTCFVSQDIVSHKLPRHMDTLRMSSKSPEKGSAFTSQCVLRVPIRLTIKVSNTVEVEHIDNPKGYGDGNDPRETDPRLRPVCATAEFAILEPLTSVVTTAHTSASSVSKGSACV